MAASISFSLHPEIVAEIEKRAEKYNLNHSAFATIIFRKAFNMPTPDMEDGFTTLNKTMDQTLEYSKKNIQNSRVDFLEDCYERYLKEGGHLAYGVLANDVAKYKYNIKNMTIDEIKLYIKHRQTEGNGHDKK